MKKFINFIKTVEVIMTGGASSSLLITGTDHWKFYLVVILLIHSFKFYNED